MLYRNSIGHYQVYTAALEDCGYMVVLIDWRVHLSLHLLQLVRYWAAVSQFPIGRVDFCCPSTDRLNVNSILLIYPDHDELFDHQVPFKTVGIELMQI